MEARNSQITEGRVCMKCGEFKPSSAFNKNGKFSDGRVRLRAICKVCGSRRKLKETAPEKRCKDCGQVKPISEFQENGLRPYCRPCNNERVYAHQRDNGRKKHTEGSMRWYRKKWDNDPEFRVKVRAYRAVKEARGRGLPKPDRCEKCDASDTKLNAHHHKGYDKEHWLDVVWLCARCHAAAHKREEESCPTSLRPNTPS